ncbi:MAG: tubulin-like doman-containing protein, partial [Lachnospiraceae bacterium]|jgi:hypothetical protein|nr:tubulin-like doman-containing protein [Lachnospiraceae bacterium]
LLNGGDVNSLWTNGYACLKELDYWMNVGKDDVFVQNYGHGIIANAQNVRVLDFCHLLSAQDIQGKKLTYNKVISSMAENIFAYIAGEVGEKSGGNTTMKSMYDNMDNYMVRANNTAAFPAHHRYLAVGTHKLEIPFEEISTLLGVRLFEQLQNTFSLVPTKETFQADMRELRLIPEQVINNSLQEGIPHSPLDENPNYQYNQIWGHGNNSPKNNRPYKDMETWMKQYRAGITRNAANYAQEKNGTFRNFVDNKMLEIDRGPVYLALLLYSNGNDSIIPTLTKMIDRCHDEENRCLNDRERMEKELLREYNAGDGVLFFNHQRAINSYLSALNNWAKNENGCEAYKARAKALKELRDNYLQKMYDDVFSKLADVLQALPSIFKQNLDYIEIMQKEASEAGLLDDTRLVWPLKFEKDNKVEFDKLLDQGRKGFLKELRDNMKRWIGVDLDQMRVNGGGSSTDIPGFLSEFISDEFGGLLQINMEEFMEAKLGGGLGLDLYLRQEFEKLKNKSYPMFYMNAAFSKNTVSSEFSLVSVPDNCLHIQSEAEKHFKHQENINVKTSREKTRLYLVKVVAGIPLYTYYNMENAEKKYEASMASAITQKGAHLRPEWRDWMPSPLVEGAWTKGLHQNDRVMSFNQKVRMAFDCCLKNEVIKPDNADAPNKYYLYEADESQDYFLHLDLTSQGPTSVSDKLQMLEDERNRLWNGTPTELNNMGNYKNLDGKHLADNVCEAVLIRPKQCERILKQAAILQSYEQKVHEISNPVFYADAVLCGLIRKVDFYIVLKRSVADMSYKVLYDLTEDKSFAEYEAYKKFCELLDDERRDDIKQYRTELFKRFYSSSEEKEEARIRAQEACDKIKEQLNILEQRMAKTPISSRKPLLLINDFYETVNKTLVRYMKDYMN